MFAIGILVWMMIAVAAVMAFVIIRYVLNNTPVEMVTAWKNLLLIALVFITCWLLAVGFLITSLKIL